MSYRVLPKALADIDSVTEYIALDNPSAAARWQDDIYDHCELLGQTPAMGVLRIDVAHDLRMFPVGNYVILYRPVEPGVEIVRVLHSARKWQDLL